jgi:hypothetical protein
VDAVGTDHQIAACEVTVITGAIDERRYDSVSILIEPDETVPQPQRTIPHALANDLRKQSLQASTMKRELRNVITSIDTALFTPYFLPEPVRIDQLFGGKTRTRQLTQHPEPGQLLDRVGQDIEADPELADPIALLEDHAIDARCV